MILMASPEETYYARTLSYCQAQSIKYNARSNYDYYVDRYGSVDKVKALRWQEIVLNILVFVVFLLGVAVVFYLLGWMSKETAAIFTRCLSSLTLLMFMMACHIYLRVFY